MFCRQKKHRRFGQQIRPAGYGFSAAEITGLEDLDPLLITEIAEIVNAEKPHVGRIVPAVRQDGGDR